MHRTYATSKAHKVFARKYSNNTLTLIRHGKGGLGAPGRCGRDTCPAERKLDAGYGFGPYAIISPFVS